MIALPTHQNQGEGYAKLHREFDVFEGVEGGDQVERLEHERQLVESQRGQIFVRRTVPHTKSPYVDVALYRCEGNEKNFRGLVDGAHHVEESGLAAT